MGKVFLGWPNKIDGGAAPSGGSWEPTLPLANLQNREMARVARSTDATLASTKFIRDFGVATALRAVSLHNHNLSLNALIRVSLGTTSGGNDIYTSNWVNAWTMAFDDDLNVWEQDNWWNGPTDSTDMIRHPFMACVVLPIFYEARYVMVEIDDTTNADGFVQIGRANLCSGFVPAYNVSQDITHGWADLSESSRADNGAMFFYERRRYRHVSMVYEYLSHTEGATVFEMLRRQGTVNEVLYVPDMTDRQQTQRYGFLGRLTELSDLQYPYPRVNKLPVKLEELL